METALSTLAQVFVGPLVGTISDHYVPAILEKIGIKWDVTEEMEKLSDILLTIQDVLEDAEDKQTTSKTIRNWLRKLKDVAYDVEDILDECATEALRDPESTGIIDKATMIERIKRLINKFEEIAEQRSKFNLINLTSTTRVVHCRVDPRRETSSFPTELKLYGRDEEKECIVNLMVNNINAENLSIYAIVGMGGLGKTTLAQMVYNDNMIKSRFEIKRWVCVSENFELKSLIGDIIQSGSNNSSQTLNQLQFHLQEEFSGKKFLIVLDDVWNEDEAKWERLKSSLTCGAKGSSIIVTTRSDKVASLMGTSPVCRPKILSEEDCFSLFKHRAFGEGEGGHYPNLESIGKEIVKKCGGVPLAAKALGGLLRFKRKKTEWLFVRNSELWDLPQDKEDSILPALRLSYKYLPQHLRQCFVYCSIFPKDYRMNKEVLIQQWMAHGFLQPKGNMELEDIGNEIFNDLVWRGFFQEVISDDFLGNMTIASCKMHDLVHDLACSITRDECFSVVTFGDEELVVGRRNTTRHLAIYHRILFSPNFSLSLIQSFLRTLLQLDVYYTYALPHPLNFSNLIYLRVLDLSGLRGLETLPESISRLKLLRYLDLSGTNIALLSDEVFGNLINLQTLKLHGCRDLKMLPGNMRKLTNLRHLDISTSTEKLVRMPAEMGQLKSLHMLSDFIVSEDSGCGVGELQELDHLGGALAITCLWKVKDLRDAENAKLSRKENIRDLRLDWSKRTTAPVPAAESQTNSRNDKLIANALQPHPNIDVLYFHGYVGSDFPRWMNSTCLPSLVEISLGDCLKCKHLPTLGLLPHLKKLSLHSIPQVECIGNEFYCDEEEEEKGNNMMKTRGGMVVLFRALEELEFYNMHRLHSLEEWKGWSSSSPSPLPSSSRMKEGEAQVSVFPLLKKLSIHDCPNLKTFPSLPLSIQRLYISECSEKIFESLGFHNYGGSDFPRWMNSTSLFSLVELELRDCSKCKHLPTLGLLPHLKKLLLRGIPQVECIGNEFYCDEEEGNNMMKTRGMVVLFPALEKLSLAQMHSLEEWKGWSSSSPSSSRMKEGEAQVSVFPVLKALSIYACPNLRTFPPLPLSIQRLYISECSEKIFERSLENLPCLSHLSIVNFPRWSPDQGMVLLQNLTALQELKIAFCPVLFNLPEGTQSLTSLKKLRIEDCDGLKYLNNCRQLLLTNLHELTIRYCRELELLPGDFQNLVSLQSLHLEALPKLAAVPALPKLAKMVSSVGSSTLETISFVKCAGLMNLPEGLQHLTALQRLLISDCHPELHRRCQKNTGEDWHKIAHIPRIDLW